eukprot:285290-Chlamydomonas_euryale.AAC.3
MDGRAGSAEVWAEMGGERGRERGFGRGVSFEGAGGGVGKRGAGRGGRVCDRCGKERVELRKGGGGRGDDKREVVEVLGMVHARP